MYGIHDDNLTYTHKKEQKNILYTNIIPKVECDCSRREISAQKPIENISKFERYSLQQEYLPLISYHKTY